MTKSTISAVAFLAAVRIFECPDVGLFPDPDDCASYYMCSYGLGGFDAEHFRCSEGYLYDALLLVIIY
jgi:Chitin binding Peritrophin-A domain